MPSAKLFQVDFSRHCPALWLIGGLSLLHLLLAGRVNLSVDEAHYALYGLKLDWSYFDHPPMVGWLNALPAHFFPSDFGMRLLPIALYALSNWILYRLTLRLFSQHPQAPWLGFWTLVLLNSGIMMQLLSQSMLPDAPLMVFSLLVIWQTLNLRQAPTLKNWALLGLWLGLAGLSKYTAVTLVFSLILLVIVERRWWWFSWRYEFYNSGIRGLLLAVAIASLLISPVLYWNATHDWISILYQLNHGTHNPDWQWYRVWQSQGAQLVVYNPVLYLTALYLMLRFGLRVKAKLDTATENTRLLSLFALPIILLFALNSGHEMSLPHWTQLAWLFMAPAVTYWLWTHWQQKGWRLFAVSLTTLSLALTALLLSHLFTPWLPFKPGQNPVQELHGWPQALQRAQQYQTQFAAQTQSRPSLFAANWTQASRIGWYGRPQPVYVTDNRFDQFDLWYGNPAKGSDGIVIIPSYESSLKTFQKLAQNSEKTTKTPPGEFAKCHQLPSFTLSYPSAFASKETLLVSYHYFYCQNYHPPHYSGWVSQLPHLTQLLPTTPNSETAP